MRATAEILPVIAGYTGGIPGQFLGAGIDRPLGVVDLVLAPLGLELARAAAVERVVGVLAERVAGKKVIVVGLPGAFTPT